MDNLTDAVFGIAITLLIFNLANPNSFRELVTFTKTLPAFLVSISFLVLIWQEHVDLSRVFGLKDSGLVFLNTLFLALIIFYVYPLRFLMLFLTNIFFGTDVNESINGKDVPYLMIYYGMVAFGLYAILFLFYQRVGKRASKFELSDYEIDYVRWQKIRLGIMFAVPLISVAITLILIGVSEFWASLIGGLTYFVYTPLIFWWYAKFDKLNKSVDKNPQELS